MPSGATRPACSVVIGSYVRSSRLTLLSDPVVFIADRILAVEPLEPPDRKMAPSYVLEVLDERIVYRGASKGADDRKRLRGYLLGHHQSEARRDLGDELQEDGRSLVDDATLGNEPCGFGYRFGEHASNREISALGGIGGSGASAQCKDLDTRENGLRIGQILSLALRDVRDRP